MSKRIKPEIRNVHISPSGTFGLRIVFSQYAKKTDITLKRCEFYTPSQASLNRLKRLIDRKLPFVSIDPKLGLGVMYTFGKRIRPQ